MGWIYRESIEEAASNAWRTGSVSTLAILDIDGTILEPASFQMDCLRRALGRFFGEYERLEMRGDPICTTDSGVFKETYLDLVGLPSTLSDEEEFRRIFLLEARAALRKQGCLRVIP